MGTRINFIFRTDTDSGVCAVLYCNNSHPDVDPVRIVRDIGMDSPGATAAIAAILSITYPSAKGNARAGERVFSLDGNMGDNEAVYECHWSYKCLSQLNCAATFVMNKRGADYRPVDLPQVERCGTNRPLMHLPDATQVDIRTSFYDDAKSERTGVTIGLNGALVVTIDGYGDYNTDSDIPERPVIMAEVFGGVARCSVWSDINKESATHSIHLDSARLSARSIAAD